jgi:hypothetical protein
LQDFDTVEHSLPGSAAAFSTELPVLRQRRLLPVAGAPGCHEKICAGILCRRLPGRPGGTAQLLLDCLAQVLEQMEAVGRPVGPLARPGAFPLHKGRSDPG